MYKVNEIVNNFLLAGDKFIPKMNLRIRGFSDSACGPFTKNKERIQKFKETGATKYIYRNELDKAWLQHDTAYGDFKDLARRTAFDKVLRDKAFDIAKNKKYGGCQRELASLDYKFFDKKSAGSSVTTPPKKSAIKNEITQNKQLAKELHKLVIEKIKKDKFILHSKTIFGVLI